ncbi:MAG: NAD(P)/FAD-dependent oxidoreductase [Bacteroidales bacterium]|jgi:phytoene dehydrogenase-like protein|nr:NAD(P)/FAD-dependent oxidoreductase [Bacteroidales bacterium]
MDKDILIIGAGISGLSTGCYAQMNGYGTAIYEMNKVPGGLCTAWQRKGYTFDISMHMLMGSVSGPMHKMWEELGVTGNFKFHFHRQISQIEGLGKKLNFSVDRKQLEDDMTVISPDDEKLIKEFTRLIFGPDIMKAASLKPAMLITFADRIRQIPYILPLIGVFTRYKRMTVQEFAARFKSPFLREAVRFFVDAPGWPMPRFPMVALAGFVRSGITEAGVPLGGSQKVMFSIANLYNQLGGEIHYNSFITDLIIENGRVAGIRLKDGTEHRAKRIIWAGDGYNLIFNILGGKYLDNKIRNMYETWIPVKPIVHVMIGVNRDLSAEPPRIIFEPEEPVTIAGREHRWMTVLHHCFDKSMAPEGKSAVEVWFDTEYEYWDDLAKDRINYNAEKQRIAEYAVRQLEKRWPGFSSQIEMIDIPTPATYVRYTGNYKGSPDGWYITDANMNVSEPVRTLPGLEGLYMVGQWTAPFTGTVMAALSGRQIIQFLCIGDSKKFIPESLYKTIPFQQ